MFNFISKIKSLFNPVVYAPIVDDDQVKIIKLTRYKLTNGHYSFHINATSINSAMDKGKEYFDTNFWVEI